jgi:hypothetical protein
VTHGEVDEPEPDDTDTGPLNIPYQRADQPDWASMPTQAAALPALPPQGTWAQRFDGPLTVTPRPVRTPRNTNVLWSVIAAVVAVVVVGGVIYWFLRPSSDDAETPSAAPTTTEPPAPKSEDVARLRELLPAGYPPNACKPVDPSNDALAQMDCAKNTDAGGPLTATYMLLRGKSALEAAFKTAMKAAEQVNCPGNIQSPGPWRRNATPQKVSGTLFCGLKDGEPTVIWTDDAQLTVNAVRSGPNGPTFPALYAWWSSHS